MIFEELIEPEATDTDRLAAQQQRERQARNEENLRDYDRRAGLAAAAPWPQPLTWPELENYALERGYWIELSVAQIGINPRKQ